MRKVASRRLCERVKLVLVCDVQAAWTVKLVSSGSLQDVRVLSHTQGMLGGSHLKQELRIVVFSMARPASPACPLSIKAESHLATCVCICVLCAYLVSINHPQNNTGYADMLHDTRKIEVVSIFLCMTLHMLAKITKCAQYTMEALVPFFTQDAQRQVCFGLKGATQCRVRFGISAILFGFQRRDPSVDNGVGQMYWAQCQDRTIACLILPAQVFYVKDDFECKMACFHFCTNR